MMGMGRIGNHGVCILMFSIIFSSVYCVIQFQCDSEHCLDQQVEYQCTVTGSGDILALTWRIRNETSDLGSTTYTSLGITSPNTLAGDFSVQQLSTNPLVSTISFTVQSSINGYTILCEEGGGDNETCTINITNPPTPPTDLTLEFTQMDFTISWIPPNFSSQCYNISSYIVKTNATGNNLPTADTSITISFSNLTSNTTYCSNVAAVDTANRTGSFSDEICFGSFVTSPLTLTNQSFARTSDDSTIIRISWMFNQANRPLLTAVYLSYTVNGMETVVKLPPTQTEFDIENVQRDMSYYIVVFGETFFGNGSVFSLNTTVPSNQTLPPPPTTTTTTTGSTTPASTVSSSSSPTGPTDSSRNSGSTVVIVISIVVPLCVVVAAVIITILIVVFMAKSKKSKPVKPNNHQPTYAELQVASDGSGMQSKTSSKESFKATSAHMQSDPTDYREVKHEITYTVPDVGPPGKSRKPPMPTVNYSSPAF